MDVRRRTHVDAGDDAHGKERRDEGAAAVGEERERQADDRHKAEADADVDQDLRGHHARDADADEAVHIVAGFNADVDDADDDGGEQEQHREAAEHPKLFADGGEDEVVSLHRKGAALHHGTVVEALAADAAVLEGADAAVDLIAFVLRVGVNRGVEEDEDAVPSVVAEVRPDRGRGARRGTRQSSRRRRRP